MPNNQDTSNRSVLNVFGKKSTEKQKPVTLGAMPMAPGGVHNDVRGEFAEIYGGAKVGQQRLFLVSLFAITLAIAAVMGLVIVSQNSIAVPVLIEVNSETGVVNKPVRIETIRPSQALIKAELGRWITKVFVLDNIQTVRLMREANSMTTGLGTQQYTEFRVKQNLMERITKDPTLQRTVEGVTVDLSQEGLAFAFLTTKEVKGSDATPQLSKFRVTLKYQLIPPTNEAEIMANPLGIYITSMNAIEEAAKK